MNGRISLPAEGPEGTNLLGFMTALGALALLELHRPDWQPELSWEEEERKGGIRPRLYLCCRAESPESAKKAVVAVLLDAIKDQRYQELFRDFEKNLKVDRELFRARLKALRDQGKWHFTDLLAGLIGEDLSGEEIVHSPLKTLNGAGHQDFLPTLWNLTDNVTADHLRRALFETWHYEDERYVFRWYPADYRPQAYRARDPASDRVHPIRTEWGANRLAFDALVFFPVLPGGQTVAFRSINESRRYEDGRQDFVMRWPLWRYPLGRKEIAGLLRLPDLWLNGNDRLQRLGVFAIVECARFMVGKGQVGFTPGNVVWTDGSA